MVDRLHKGPPRVGTSQSWVLTVLLGGMTGLALLANLPSGDALSDYTSEALIYAFLTGFALVFGVWLSNEVALSPAHVIGIVAFLSLPEDAYALLVWAVFGGSGLGIAIRHWRGPSLGRVPRQRLNNAILIMARVTLSFIIAAQVYIGLDGALPLEHITWETIPDIASAITGYSLTYLLIYLTIFCLELYINGYNPAQVIQLKWPSMLVISLLPIPFAIFSAEVAGDPSSIAELMRLLGLAVIIIGLHALSQSEHQLRAQLNELHMLEDIKRAMRSHLDLNDLVTAIYQQVRQILAVENFSVALYEEERARLEYALVMRKGQPAPSHDQETIVSRYIKTPTDYVHQTGKPLLISQQVQVTADAMHLQAPGGDVTSWMGVPLIFGERILGVLTAYCDDQERRFGDKDLRLLNIIADSASVAIANAILYSRQAEQLELMTILNQIVAMLSGTLSAENVLDTVISSASALSQANAVAVYLHSEDQPEILPLERSAGLSNDFVKNAPIPLLWRDRSTPLYAQAPLVISDVEQDPRTTDFRAKVTYEGLSSLVELPLSVGETGVVGVLVVYFDKVQHFSTTQTETMRAFATQVAQSITNARTYTTTDAALRRSIEQLLTLSDIGRTLAATIDLPTIGELALKRALEATHGSMGLVVIYDDNAELQVITQEGYAEVISRKNPMLNQGITKEVLNTSKIHRIGDVNAEEKSYPTWIESTRSQLCVPILRGSELRGYIIMERNQVNGFSAEDTHFVAQIANQAVIAIDNAQLFVHITEARDQMAAILNAMEEAVILVDIFGKIVLVNPRVDMLELTPTQLLNRYLTDLMKDSSLAFAELLGFASMPQMGRFFYDLSRTDDWKEYTPQLYQHHKENSTLHIQRYIIPVTDEQEKTIGALMVFYNKTEEEELQHARDEFSRMVVHDLRSPLTAVTTGLKLLRDMATEDNALYPIIEMTTDSSGRAIRKLLSRVSSLLDIAKLESGKLTVDTEFTELTYLATGVFDELNPLAQELEIKLTTQIPDALPPLDIDEDKVERLLLNLVDNALKYSPIKSEILIRAHDPGQNGAPEHFVRVEVVDNGPGIPDEYRTSLFESYVQVEGRQKVRSGVGLGLTFCKLVAEAHGGKIWIEDNPTGGSIFSFTLPAAQLTRPPGDE
jgi:signal transduction histidine kinase